MVELFKPVLNQKYMFEGRIFFTIQYLNKKGVFCCGPYASGTEPHAPGVGFQRRTNRIRLLLCTSVYLLQSLYKITLRTNNHNHDLYYF